MAAIRILLLACLLQEASERTGTRTSKNIYHVVIFLKCYWLSLEKGQTHTGWKQRRVTILWQSHTRVGYLFSCSTTMTIIRILLLVCLLQETRALACVNSNRKSFSYAIKNGFIHANVETTLYEHDTGQPGVITEQCFMSYWKRKLQ